MRSWSRSPGAGSASTRSSIGIGATKKVPRYRRNGATAWGNHASRGLRREVYRRDYGSWASRKADRFVRSRDAIEFESSQGTQSRLDYEQIGQLFGMPNS